VWILRLHHPSMAALVDLRALANLQARCVALVPGKCTLLHKQGFWQSAKWDEEKTEHAAQVWMLGGQIVADRESTHHTDLSLAALGNWTGRRYDFHWCTDQVPTALRLYREHQQDARQYTFQGLVGGTDGSANNRTGRMGAGFALGIQKEPLMTYSVSVGGPLAPLRAEAASLFQLLRRVRERFPSHVNLLVFIDCLVLLDILLKWGRSDFQPQPRDIVHFDVLVPLLSELRSWPGTVVLMKVKSHAGCLLNERADALADLGALSEEEQIFPGPSKYGTLWLRARASWRDRVRSEQLHHVLPRDSAPNKSILKQIITVNLFRAMAK
jgi:ribonuclease HI